MECAQTLDMDMIDGALEEGEEEEEVDRVWGRLFPLGKGFVAQDLVEDECSFGRGEACDYCFESKGCKGNPHFAALSKTHFVLFRQRDKADPHKYTVFVRDKSSNGTFVNGEKIGRNKTQVLNNNDEISLALKKNKVFIFNDVGESSKSDQLPEELRAKYTMSKLLGRGACGEVKLAFEKGTCNKFAVKVISKRTFSLGPKIGRAAMEEAKLLCSLNHPCIVHIQDMFDCPDTLYIVLELAEGGELFDRVVDVGKFREPVAKLLFYQILVAVEYLHHRGVTHRDLKPENVLLASDAEETLVKVTDFGLSRMVGEQSLMQTLCGTPTYLAPEVLQTSRLAGYSKAVDCWSLGVILYIMLGGYPPFSDEITEFSLKEQICGGRYSFPEAYWRDVSQDGIDLIRQLLTLDPDKRISTAKALQHPWMQDEEVIARATKLIAAEESKESMPPPPLPGVRKRPAPTYEDTSPPKPAKRQTLDATNSPPSSPPPSSSPPPLSEAPPPTTPLTPLVDEPDSLLAQTRRENSNLIAMSTGSTASLTTDGSS